MLRIGEDSLQKESATLSLAGQVSGPWVGVLRESCERMNHCRLMLDLAEVTFADLSGLALLRELQEREVTLLNCSPFLQEQLKSVSLTTPGAGQ
jgi:ABC-type transporter Mla MlaB component